MAYSTVKFLDTIQISPPTGLVPTTSLPLAIFDLNWFNVGPVERLFFYEFPHPTSYFMETTLPLLKRSLSQALQLFFPYAANIMCPPPPGKPYIHYVDGDFVTFKVAESAANFNHVVANYPRDIRLLRPFVPQLPPPRVAEDGTRVLPTIAFQVTVFPNSGVCLGSTYCHVVGDGKSFIHFMRSWASITRSGSGAGDLACLENSLPLLNKDVIKAPAGAELAQLKSYWRWISFSSANSCPTTHLIDIVEDKVRATFVLSRAHAERLKHLVKARCMKGVESEQFHLSTFVVTTAFIWVCLIKSKDQRVTKDSSHDDDDDKFYSLLFPIDFRNRLEFPVPATYFGNCLKPCLVDVKGSEILGENGIVLAAMAIGNKIKEMEGNKGLEDAVHWVSNIVERIKTGRLTPLAGSPKLQVYDIDFGWGKPCKVELTHIDHDGAISLAECRDEQGGIEVGLALNKNQMDEFITVFEQSFKLL